jgi:hypothetical protein
MCHSLLCCKSHVIFWAIAANGKMIFNVEKLETILLFIGICRYIVGMIPAIYRTSLPSPVSHRLI